MAAGGHARGREVLAHHSAGADDLPLVVDEDLVMRNATVQRLAEA